MVNLSNKEGLRSLTILHLHFWNMYALRNRANGLYSFENNSAKVFRKAWASTSFLTEGFRIAGLRSVEVEGCIGWSIGMIIVIPFV